MSYHVHAIRIEYSDAWYDAMNRGRRHETVFDDKQDYNEEITQVLWSLFYSPGFFDDQDFLESLY